MGSPDSKEVLFTCPRCGAPVSADSSAGLCLACASRSLERSLFRDDALPVDDLRDHPVIPGWEVVRLIGSGGMGQLWLARSEEGNRDGVVKIPVSQASDREEIEERFETEVELLSGLDHENILRVEDVGTAGDGRLFFVTEFVEGCDLRRLLRAERLPEERAIDTFCKVCRAIEHAHCMGVVHRDIKPSNVLVAADGTVKVADFGLAKNVQVPSGDGRTLAGDGLGTPYYLAPESMRDAASADERADVFSLGVLLYEMLTGSVPAGSFTRLSERCGFSKGWDSLVQAALNDAPDRRIASVAEMRRTVEKLWAAEARRALWGDRIRWGSACALVLVVGIVAGLLVLRGWTAAAFVDPSKTDVGSPWSNGLGMAFLKSEGFDGREILMAVTETRLADFSAFHRFDGGDVPEWRIDAPGAASMPGTVVMRRAGWKLLKGANPADPGFPITPEHPVCGITSVDAWAFCTWLTMKERAEGRIKAHQRYRLPTVFEWLSATRGMDRAVGNFAREEVMEMPWPPDRPHGVGRDPFPCTAPVGTFPANPNGFHEMDGNVAEWVLPYRAVEEPGSNDARFIGGSWADPPPQSAEKPRAKLAQRDGFRRTDIGFRVVLDLGDSHEGEATE